MRAWRSHDRNPRKKVVGNRGFGAEPAGAFENANRGAERYAVARSNTTDDANADTRGYAVAPPRAIFLKRYALLLHSDGLFESHCMARASGNTYWDLSDNQLSICGRTSRASLQCWHKQQLIL